jgi:hypothetical protein
METLLNSNLFVMVFFIFLTSFSSLKASTSADTKGYEFKTQAITTKVGDCSSNNTVKSNLPSTELESKTTQALTRIDSEGILECNNLANQNEQSKCLKVLDVAREMIKLAHQKQLKHIACR